MQNRLRNRSQRGVTTLLLVFATPAGTAAFWLTLGAFVVLLAMHAAYWVLTHPVNNFWLKDFKLEGASGHIKGRS